MEADDAHWFRPSPASNSGPAARAFHAAAALGTTLFAHGGHVYVKEKKGLHKFDDLWALETVGGQALFRVFPPPCSRHGGRVYVREKKGLHKVDDLWALETVGGDEGLPTS